MRRAARVTLARTATVHAPALPASRGRRCAAQKELQGLVVRALPVALAQSLWVERAQHRPAARIDDRHHDLRPARHVEDDAVEHRAAGGDLHELSWKKAIH